MTTLKGPRGDWNREDVKEDQKLYGRRVGELEVERIKDKSSNQKMILLTLAFIMAINIILLIWFRVIENKGLFEGLHGWQIAAQKMIYGKDEKKEIAYKKQNFHTDKVAYRIKNDKPKSIICGGLNHFLT